MTVGSSDSGVGGDVYMQAGNTIDTGSNGGSVSVVTGGGESSSSGRVTVRSSNAVSVGESGSVVLSSGTTADGNSGAVTLASGSTLTGGQVSGFMVLSSGTSEAATGA